MRAVLPEKLGPRIKRRSRFLLNILPIPLPTEIAIMFYENTFTDSVIDQYVDNGA
jgi:hypothetical protein